jgi:hypothetical protein
MGNWNWGWELSENGLWILPYWAVGCFFTVVLCVILLLLWCWFEFCWRIAKGKIWGYFLLISPVLTAPIFIGLYYDLTKGL